MTNRNGRLWPFILCDVAELGTVETALRTGDVVGSDAALRERVVLFRVPSVSAPRPRREVAPPIDRALAIAGRRVR